MELDAIAAAATPAAQWDERDLVARARRDRTAFALLYRAHYARIASYVFRRVGDRTITEDLTADVFLTALRTIHRYRDRGLPVTAWLYRIATNRVNRWARRERGRAMAALSTAEADRAPALGRGDPVDELGAARARHVLLTLAPRHQAVMALHYLEGLSLEEVAGILGCKPGTVKSRLARGRQAAREIWSKGGRTREQRA